MKKFDKALAFLFRTVWGYIILASLLFGFLGVSAAFTGASSSTACSPPNCDIKCDLNCEDFVHDCTCACIDGCNDSCRQECENACHNTCDNISCGGCNKKSVEYVFEVYLAVSWRTNNDPVCNGNEKITITGESPDDPQTVRIVLRDLQNTGYVATEYTVVSARDGNGDIVTVEDGAVTLAVSGWYTTDNTDTRVVRAVDVSITVYVA